MSDMPTDPELPRAVALAWGVAANPQRGPKRELSIERIVDVAVELADAGGLPSVSMAAVASELGFTPMSLYRYVSAKDDLLVLMQERGIGLPPESVLEQEGVRARLRE
ncbi:helix-turn-helix transcriptional regulator, partial [Schumannella luteola]